MIKHYSIVKENYNYSMSTIPKLKGFTLNPKNQVEYDGIVVNELVLINQSFIEKVLKKKIKRKLDLYLRLIVQMLSEDGSSEDGESLRQALNDLSRYKQIVEYKYQKYLDEKYVALLLQKIALLEHELKQKLIYIMEPMEYAEESTKGRGR